MVALDDPWEREHGGTIRTRALIRAITASGASTCLVYLGHSDGAVSPDTENVELVRINTRPLGESSLGRSRLGAAKRHFLPMPSVVGARLASVTAAVERLHPELVVVSQLRAVQLAGHRRVWLDQADVMSAMLEPEIRARHGAARMTARAQRRMLMRTEARSVVSAEINTVAGFADARRVQLLDPAARWLPTPVARHQAGDVTAKVAGMLGNFAFWPNVDAYDFMCASWLPHLRDDGWQVIVAGYGSENLTPCSGVTLVGPVSDVAHYYREIRLSLAPIRLGSGIKVKVVEALRAARPVLATPAALDGLSPLVTSGVPTLSEGDDYYAVMRGVESHDWQATYRAADTIFAPEQFTRSVSELLEGRRAVATCSD